MTNNVVLCAPVRAASGVYGGTLKDMPALQIGSITGAGTLKRARVGGDAVDTILLGQVVQAGARMNPAHQAAFGGGVPDDVPAMAVNGVCGSGAQAIAIAAQDGLIGGPLYAITIPPSLDTYSPERGCCAYRGRPETIWSRTNMADVALVTGGRRGVRAAISRSLKEDGCAHAVFEPFFRLSAAKTDDILASEPAPATPPKGE